MKIKISKSRCLKKAPLLNCHTLMLPLFFCHFLYKNTFQTLRPKYKSFKLSHLYKSHALFLTYRVSIFVYFTYHPTYSNFFELHTSSSTRDSLSWNVFSNASLNVNVFLSTSPRNVFSNTSPNKNIFSSTSIIVSISKHFTQSESTS